MSANIRMLTNATFVVEKGDVEESRKFEYGCYYPVTLIERDTETGYCDIHFPDGSKMVGITQDAFTNYGAQVIDVTPTVEVPPEPIVVDNTLTETKPQ